MFDLLAVTLGRPNALDREVSAIPVSSLLTKSPYDLLDPARAAAALHMQQLQIPIWIVTIALQIAVLAWFWSSGWSARLRDGLRARTRAEFAVRFFFGATVTLVDKIAAFIPQLLQYRVTRIMDLSNDLTRTWLAGWITGTIVAMIVAGLIAAIVLWLADRTHQWYLYTIAGVVGFTLLVTYAYPSAIAPLSARFVSLDAAPFVRSAIAEFEPKTGVRPVPVLEERVAAHTHVGSSYVMGWGGSQRIVIADTFLAGSTEPERRFAMARAFAWIGANDALHVALIQGGFIVIGAALAIFIADRFGFRRDDDPVSRLALVGALMGCVYLIAIPFYNGYTRNLERGTDEAALAMTGDRASAIRAVVRHADQALRPICPQTFAYWYFDGHLSTGARISSLQGRPDICTRR